MHDERFLTTTDAARVLNRSSDCVRLYERSGKLPAQRTRSGQRLFKLSDVERLANSLTSQRHEL